MKVIAEFEMPKCCDECPCFYQTEGVSHDYCKLLGYESQVPENFNIWRNRLDNCPLKIKEK